MITKMQVIAWIGQTIYMYENGRITAERCLEIIEEDLKKIEPERAKDWHPLY